jgi:hypothetical protein
MAKSHRRSISLGYRNGDDDQSSAQRRRNLLAVASTGARTSGSRQNPNPAQVAPKTSESERPGGLLGGLLSRTRPRRRITARNNHTDSEQFKLDEYLEYIDRRYKRVHAGEVSSVKLRKQSESKKTSKHSEDDKGISTALNWLLQGSSSSSATDDCDALCQQQKQRDALEVLGLAGLASAELLRKHHLPVPEETTVTAVTPIGTSTAAAITKRDIIDVQTTPSSSPSTGGKLSLLTQHRLLALTIRSMVFKAIANTLLLTKTALSTLPALPTKLGEMAGGRRTVKIATALALGVFCVVVNSTPLGMVALKHN